MTTNTESLDITNINDTKNEGNNIDLEITMKQHQEAGNLGTNNGITFQMLQNLKLEHARIYEEGSGSQIELLNYLYDVLDNINSEIIKQNKQRIKAKYGSLLPPNAVRNKQQSTSGASGGSTGINIDVGSSGNGGGADNDGFQQVMPKRSAGKSGGRGSREGRPSSSARSSGSSSYSQPYKSDSERVSNGGFGLSGYKSSGKGRSQSTPSSTVSSNGISSGMGGGVLSKLLSADRVKMAINRELNKISSTNMDAITASINDVFATWFLDELNNDTPVNNIRERYNKYLSDLWNNLIGKSLTQPNMSDVYFKFLRRLMTASGSQSSLMSFLKAKSPVMASRFGTWQPGFHELSEYKTELLNEINLFLKEPEYFTTEDNRLVNKVGGTENLANIQDAFSILGLFAKYFLDVPGSGGRARNTPSAWDIMLLAIYANFKLLNELLYWEPVNLEEVERRVFFTVGFLEDNRGFIQSLDTDFYRDIECQLDSIKKCASIPASVKYKLFDCIDNFILMRKSGTGARK